jgi:glycosyltransferase involved in cell wall biosynthesis
MRLVSITCVKNESDIVEAFVRHTHALVDQLIILDNGSTDNTPEILRSLEKDGLSLEIVDDPSPGKHQWKRMTRLMHEFAVERHKADWIVPLDIDEFIVTPEGADLHDLLAEAKGPVGQYWRTYVPDPSNDKNEPNPALRIRHCLAEEYHPWMKIIIPGNLASQSGAVITQGSHKLELNGKLIDPLPIDSLRLAHIPIRSPEQFLAKVVIGHLQYMVMPKKNKAWGWHYKIWYDKLKQDPGAFAASYREAALRFAVKPEEDFDPQVILKPIRYLGDDLAYSDLQGDKWQALKLIMDYTESLAKIVVGKDKIE